MTLFQEFKRRNVFRVAAAYAVVSWLIIQVSSAAVPAMQLPDWVNSFIFLLLALGLVPALVFAWAFELTSDGLKREKDVDRSQSITGDTGRKLNFVTLVALVLTISLVAAERFIFPGAGAPSDLPSEVSIAVLPFVDMSPNKDQEYFSDGISEEILNGLARLKTMKVAGRTSSFAFKGRNEDLREIGSALGVQNILEGSVRKDGDRLRITAQLIKVSDGFHLWSETYDRELRDVFAVQDEISAAIVKELQGNLLGDKDISDVTHEVDIAVYEKYLLARKKMVIRSNVELLEARRIFEEIIAVAPDFPPALSSLAETVILLRGDTFNAYGDLDPEESRLIATPLLDRAIEIDPNFADAFAVRGLMLYSDGRWKEAESALLRAVELNPSLSNAWNWLGNNAGAQNRVEDSLRYLSEAAAIDPLWMVPNSNLISRYASLGRGDEARAIVERLRPFHQDSANFHSSDGQLRGDAGELADALRAYRIAYDLAPDTPAISSQTAFALLVLQEFDEALEIVPPQFAVMRNFLTGEWDDALPHLREALGDDPLHAFLLFPYLSGANYVGDYEAIARLYDEYIKIPETIRAASRDFLLPQFVPAMAALEREEDRTRLLAAYRESLSEDAEQGVVSADLDRRWAEYYALAGDNDLALSKLQQAFSKGARWNLWDYEFALNLLEADPRMIALKQQNLDAINSERQKFGWEPVSKIGLFVQTD